MALELDERAVSKLNRLLARTVEQARSIAAESARRADQRGGVFATELGMLHFKRGSDARGRAGPGAGGAT